MSIPVKPACVDHLVVLAPDLQTGVQWCEQYLGVTPAVGGEHPLMGTHNRLLNVSSRQHPRAYLEIIAIHPGATKLIPESARRWFDMDDAALQRLVAAQGPHLVTWVASVPDVAAASAALGLRGLDCGDIVSAQRATAQGLLSWRITVRSDGQRQMQGCLPALIQWGDAHPCDHLPPSGVQLTSLELEHPQADVLQAACASIGLADVPVRCAPAPHLTARLSTPNREVVLRSPAPA